MAKNTAKSTDQKLVEEGSQMIGELVTILKRSQLPEGKILAYLYLIASGRFSLDDMDRLLKDMDEAEDALENQKKALEIKITELRKQADSAQSELFDMRLGAARELEENADKLLNALKEEKVSEGQEKDIKAIKKKLSS